MLPLAASSADADAIPQYPVFKALELSDQASITAFVSREPLYSDFEFASLWSWNVQGQAQVSRISQCLAFRLTDYLTGRPFYTYCGEDRSGEVAHALIERSESEGLGSVLNLVPETALPPDADAKYEITPNRDDFDYIIRLERCLTYAGSALRSRRNQLNGFVRRCPECSAEALRVASQETRLEIASLYDLWSVGREDACPFEQHALERFLDASHLLPHAAIGLRLDQRLVAFHISSVPSGMYANGMFEKADTRLPGVYQALMREVARALVARGKTYLNYQQDLGMASLRQAKRALDPERYLRKFTLGLRQINQAGAERPAWCAIDHEPQIE